MAMASGRSLRTCEHQRSVTMPPTFHGDCPRRYVNHRMILKSGGPCKNAPSTAVVHKPRPRSLKILTSDLVAIYSSALSGLPPFMLSPSSASYLNPRNSVTYVGDCHGPMETSRLDDIRHACLLCHLFRICGWEWEHERE